MNFGTYIFELRKKEKKTLKNVSEAIKISVTYLKDIEYSYRVAPDAELVDAIALYFKLSEEETIELYDLAADSRKDVPQDIKKFILNNPDMKEKIRELIKNEENKDVDLI